MAVSVRQFGVGCLAMAFVGLGACTPPGSSSGSSTGIGACPTSPADSYWHANVASLPVHPRSAAWVSSIGTTQKFHTDFGSGLWENRPIGFPVTVVGSGQARVPVSFLYASESDPGPYPLPYDAAVEAGQDSTGDRHVIVVDRDACRSYELFDAHRGSQPAAPWTAGSGASYDLRSNALRPAGWTSADAAGLPILPGLVQYDEVASGRIDHAIRFTAPLTQRAYIWPARHFASSSTDVNRPPMGAWFRLRADYPTASMAPQARVIAEAMKVHGIILADNGASWYLSGTPDERWDNAALHQIDSIAGSNMVAVDSSGLMIDPNSAASR